MTFDANKSTLKRFILVNISDIFDILFIRFFFIEIDHNLSIDIDDNVRCHVAIVD